MSHITSRFAQILVHAKFAVILEPAVHGMDATKPCARLSSTQTPNQELRGEVSEISRYATGFQTITPNQSKVCGINITPSDLNFEN